MVMPVDFQRAETMIDLLPPSARWWVHGVALDWSFSVARWQWQRADELKAVGWEPDEGLGIFRVFGEYHYDGGAAPFVAIHAWDGTVHGVDVEAERPVFSFNSSLDAFVQTFRLLDPLMRGSHSPPETIEAEVRAVDRGAYDTSEWSSLLEYLLAH